MKPALVFEMDTISKRLDEMIKRVMKDATEGCSEWWKKQPINFIHETLEELEAVIESGNSRAIEVAFNYAEAELMMGVRFYNKLEGWVQSVICIPLGEKIYHKVIPDHLMERARKAGIVDE